jgi:hypothetical protein
LAYVRVRKRYYGRARVVEFIGYRPTRGDLAIFSAAKHQSEAVDCADSQRLGARGVAHPVGRHQVWSIDIGQP